MAISPQTGAGNAEVKEKLRLDYPILTDAGNAYAGELGLVHGLPEDLREAYTGFGIVLPEVNGDDSWTLPLPTRLVVDGDGVIRSVDADPDYTRRPEADASVDVLRSF